jgi:type I restriction enzyme S subunit
MKWRVTNFGDFAEIQPAVILDKGEAYDFIPMEIVEPDHRNVQPVETRIWDGGGGARFQNGDTIFARITPCLEHGKTAQVCSLEKGAGFGSTEFLVFRGRPSVSDADFIYYLACSNIIREPAIKSMVGASGRQRAQRTVIEGISVRVPGSIEAQREIASILSTYDALLENNRRRMKLLEESARLLFQEWFVRLRFPGHERVKVKEGVPAGWEKRRLADIAEINRASLPGGYDGEILYVDIASVTPGSINEASPMESREAPSRAKRIVAHGDTIWSCVRPNRRSHAIIWNPPDNLIVSTGFAVLTPTAVSPAFLYYAVTTDDFVGYLENHATGAAYPAVVSGDFARALLLVPPEVHVRAFEEFASPVLNQIKNLHTQNQKLKTARDLLLPRLMSGELVV